MINFVFFAIIAGLLWLMLRELKIIASDTQKKADLTDAMDKFAAIYLADKEKKMIAFKARAAAQKDDE
jgi:hypothetical protein